MPFAQTEHDLWIGGEKCTHMLYALQEQRGRRLVRRGRVIICSSLFKARMGQCEVIPPGRPLGGARGPPMGHVSCDGPLMVLQGDSCRGRRRAANAVTAWWGGFAVGTSTVAVQGSVSHHGHRCMISVMI